MRFCLAEGDDRLVAGGDVRFYLDRALNMLFNDIVFVEIGCICAKLLVPEVLGVPKWSETVPDGSESVIFRNT